MSWPLLNHNHYPHSVPDGDVPGVGEEITSSIVYVSGVPDLAQRDALSAWTGSGFFAAGTNDKIMAIEDFSWTVQFSDDLGDTWAVKDTPVTHDSYHAAGIQYRESDDTWFIIMITDPTGARDGYLYYSQDDADTWTRVDLAPYFDYRYTTALVLADDNVAGSGYANAGGDNLAIELYTNTPASDASVRLLHTDRVNDVQNHLLEFGTGHIIQNNFSQYITITEPGATSSNNYAASYAGYGWGSNPDGRLLLPVSFSTDTLTYGYWLATGTSQGASDTEQFSNTINGSGFGWSEEEGYMMVTGNAADLSQLQIKFSPDGALWTNEYFVDLTVDKESTAGSYNFNQFQLRNIGSGRWLIGFINNSTDRINIALFTFAAAQNPLGQYTGLVAAIMPMQPDIFIRMDDEIAATTVVDVGSKGYTNTTTGTLTFDQDPLVVDGGRAVLVGASTDTGVLIEQVPTPLAHAHVFVVQHDDSATLRVLAGSQEEGYVIVLSTTHQLGYGVYDGGWTYTYSTEVVTTGVPTLMAARVDAETVTLYVQAVYDSITEVTGPTAATGLLTLGGLSTGGTTLASSASGVTIDYYVLIPNENFIYGDLADAFGLSYTPPSISIGDSDGTAEFLVHLDETEVAGPFPSRRINGDYYTVINSVPGTINRVSVANIATFTTSGKFNGAISIPQFDSFVDPWKPHNALYWPIWNASPQQMGLPEIIFGRREFCFASWINPVTTMDVCPISGQWLEATGNGYRTFGGISVRIMPDPALAGTAKIVLWVGTPKGSSGSQVQFIATYRQVPGYTVGSFMHFALTRSTQSNGELRFNVFLNGVRAMHPSVTNYTPNSYVNGFIYEGGAPYQGNYVIVSANGSAISRAGGAIIIDDAIMILDDAVYTEDFTPPVAAYTLT